MARNGREATGRFRAFRSGKLPSVKGRDLGLRAPGSAASGPTAFKNEASIDAVQSDRRVRSANQPDQPDIPACRYPAPRLRSGAQRLVRLVARNTSLANILAARTDTSLGSENLRMRLDTKFVRDEVDRVEQSVHSDTAFHAKAV